MSIPWKIRVKADVDRYIRKNKQFQKYIFKQRYNKLNDFEFPKVDDIDTNRFFCFPKLNESFIMSTSAMAIYPVLCLQSDFEDNKWFQISQKKIAKLAGLSVPTVAKGIEDLQNMYLGQEPFLEKQKRIRETRRFDVYKVAFIRKKDIKRGEYFTFHKCIVDSGVWAELSPRAKALYLSMRVNAHFDLELYGEIEEDFIYEGYELGDFILSEGYRNRKWDVSDKPLAELCKTVGITSVNLKPVLKQLENHRLIERIYENRSIFKVYLKPKIR